MANPELGSKQICPACSSKFYDLMRRPAVCPKCGSSFDPEEAIRSRRTRVRAPLPDDDIDEKPKAAVEPDEDGFEAEPDDAPEIDQAGPDDVLVTDDEDERDPDSMTPSAPEDELGVDFAEDEEDLEEVEDDVPFLEDEDDGFSEDEIDGLPGEGDVEDR